MLLRRHIRDENKVTKQKDVSPQPKKVEKKEVVSNATTKTKKSTGKSK